MGAISFSADPELLKLLRESLGIQTFAETGTYRGDTLEMASGLFPECHSAEMSDELYAAVAKRFAGRAGVDLFHGGSPEFLRANHERFAAVPTLFWLDAHWCSGENTAGMESQSPLIDELRAIGRLHPKSVVLIDDARLYLATPPAPHRVSDWPDFHAVVQALLELSPTHRLMVWNDVILFYPEAVSGVVKEFTGRHGTDWLVLAHHARAFANRPRGVKAKLRRAGQRLRRKLWGESA
jgi:hypothetical protein